MMAVNIFAGTVTDAGTASEVRVYRSVRLWVVLGSVFLAGVAGAAPEDAARTRILERYGELPLSFEANRGQLPRAVRFSSRGPGYALFLTAQEAVLQVGPAAIRGRVLGARAGAALVGERRMPAVAHYLIGSARSRWQRNVPLYSRVRYRAVLPGVDLVYYGNQRQLEYDFVVAPGTDPATIRMRYSGMDRVERDPGTGDLLLHTAAGVVTLRRPLIYQEIGARRVEVAGAYRLRKGRGWTDVSFAIGDYDRRQPLVIDPVVAYSTYVGSNRYDAAAGVAIGADGSAYVTGTAGFSNFPTTPGAFQPTSSHTAAGTEVFVSKLSPDGTSLVYSTFLGGSTYENGAAVAVDGAGSAYLTGYTGSADFPVVGSLQPYAGGGGDVFVSKLTPDGSDLVYSTFIGGTNPTDMNSWDLGEAIAVNQLGQAHVTGRTGSSDFPIRNAAQATYGGEYSDAFALKLAADGGSLIYSTFLGGSERDGGYGIAMVPGNNAVFVVGSTGSEDFPSIGALQDYAGDGDAFVTRLTGAGAITFSSHFGGQYEDLAEAVAVDANRRPVIVGRTYSDDLPTVHPFQTRPDCVSFGCQNAFVTRLRADGQTIGFSSYLGGSDIDVATGVAIDAAGDIYIAGQTYSMDFPLENPFQHCSAGRFEFTINADAFVTKLSAGAASPDVAYSSCLGGGGAESATGIGLDAEGGVYLAGVAGGGLPTTAGAFQTALRKGNNQDPADNLDAFVAKIEQDADAAPDVIELIQPVFNVYEDQGIAYIKVSRTGSGFGQIQIRVLCTGGTAVEGEDYNDIDGGFYLSWPNGQTGNRKHTILITDDGPGEGTETVNCTLDAPGGYGLSVLGEQTSAVLRIRERAPAAAGLTTGDTPDRDDAVQEEAGCRVAGQPDGGLWLAALSGLLLVWRRRCGRRAQRRNEAGSSR
jgi:hypothetical protein